MVAILFLFLNIINELKLYQVRLASHFHTRRTVKSQELALSYALVRLKYVYWLIIDRDGWNAGEHKELIGALVRSYIHSISYQHGKISELIN